MRTQTWPNLGIPYEIADGVQVRASTTPVLTIPAGTTLLFAAGARLEIGRGSGENGALRVEGTEDTPVLLTSAASNKNPGDWGNDGGIEFWDEAPNDSEISHAVIEFGTNNVWFFHNIGAIISNSVIRNASDCGIRWRVLSDHTTDMSATNTFEGNAIGAQCERIP